MRSPFPGMDPYLEDPGGWGGVYDALIALLREQLNRDMQWVAGQVQRWRATPNGNGAA